MILAALVVAGAFLVQQPDSGARPTDTAFQRTVDSLRNAAAEARRLAEASAAASQEALASLDVSTSEFRDLAKRVTRNEQLLQSFRGTLRSFSEALAKRDSSRDSAFRYASQAMLLRNYDVASRDARALHSLSGYLSGLTDGAGLTSIANPAGYPEWRQTVDDLREAIPDEQQPFLGALVAIAEDAVEELPFGSLLLSMLRARWRRGDQLTSARARFTCVTDVSTRMSGRADRFLRRVGETNSAVQLALSGVDTVLYRLRASANVSANSTDAQFYQSVLAGALRIDDGSFKEAVYRLSLLHERVRALHRESVVSLEELLAPLDFPQSLRAQCALQVAHAEDKFAVLKVQLSQRTTQIAGGASMLDGAFSGLAELIRLERD